MKGTSVKGIGATDQFVPLTAQQDRSARVRLRRPMRTNGRQAILPSPRRRGSLDQGGITRLDVSKGAAHD
jgi:hypothetical protein